ncbi:MAG: hypothetical protein H6744_00145 [Deltaproteobacteria bacterium]|nr:hypothetical protein [Deltaproteobacteria bacterium]
MVAVFGDGPSTILRIGHREWVFGDQVVRFEHRHRLGPFVCRFRIVIDGDCVYRRTYLNPDLPALLRLDFFYGPDESEDKDFFLFLGSYANSPTTWPERINAFQLSGPARAQRMKELDRRAFEIWKQKQDRKNE